VSAEPRVIGYTAAELSAIIDDIESAIYMRRAIGLNPEPYLDLLRWWQAQIQAAVDQPSEVVQ